VRPMVVLRGESRSSPGFIKAEEAIPLGLFLWGYKPVGKEPRDHILAVCKAGISAVPVVGGPIASLIGDYIPTATQKIVRESIDMLGKRLEELGDRVDAEYVNKDEFAELFKSCYLILIRTHQEEKRRCPIHS